MGREEEGGRRKEGVRREGKVGKGEEKTYSLISKKNTIWQKTSSNVHVHVHVLVHVCMNNQ